MDSNKIDGLLLREWRSAKYGLREFCRKFEEVTGKRLPHSNLSEMEKGKRAVPDYVIEKAAPLLNKKPEDFPEYSFKKLPRKVWKDPLALDLINLLFSLSSMTPDQRKKLGKFLESQQTSGS